MTSRAPQTKPAAPTRPAKKLDASAHSSREARSASVKPTARNLLKSSPMRGFRSSDSRRRPVSAEESSSRPEISSSPSTTLTSRKAAMSNKTAPAKDTTEEYREDSVEN